MDESYFKKNTPVRSINYVRISHYLSENGLTLSPEKSHMVLFNSGCNPESLPSFKIDDSVIEYKQVVKFLGVYLTSKLTWNYHLEYILTKARKTYNF